MLGASQGPGRCRVGASIGPVVGCGAGGSHDVLWDGGGSKRGGKAGSGEGGGVVSSLSARVATRTEGGSEPSSASW